MKRSEIVRLYHDRFKKTTKYYDRLLRGFEPDDVHDFRVEIKKLRALIRLTSHAHPESATGIPKPIKDFYHCVGDVRNLQLYQQAIAGYCKELSLDIPSVYLQMVHEKEEEKKKEAMEMEGNISFKDFEKELCGQAPKKISTEEQHSYIEQTRSKLLTLLALSVLSDDTLHEIRKILKDLMYNFEYFEHAVYFINIPSLSTLEEMKATTTKLGDYLDICVTVSFLHSENYPGEVDVREAAVLDRIMSYLLSKKESMKSEIIRFLEAAKLRVEFEKDKIMEVRYMKPF